jgi:hypothetical protein
MVLFSGCLSVKPSSVKSGKIYFETFYVGGEGTQYFIKPLLFSAEKPSDELIVDLTFRYRNEIKDSVLVNFSVKSLGIYKTIDSLKISNDNAEAITKKVELLFNEKNKLGYTSRFTSQLSLQETKELFNHSNWNFTLSHQGQSMNFTPNKKTHKAIATVREKVFILM